MFSKRFVYRPNHFGNFELSGPAILHNEIAENYRKDEINELIKDKDLRLEFRKSDKGIWSLNQYGYCKEEVFFDLNKGAIFKKTYENNFLLSVRPINLPIMKNK